MKWKWSDNDCSEYGNEDNDYNNDNNDNNDIENKVNIHDNENNHNLLNNENQNNDNNYNSNNNIYGRICNNTDVNNAHDCETPYLIHSYNQFRNLEYMLGDP